MGVAELNDALGDAQRALLDSSALIAFHSTAEPAHLLARHVLSRIESAADPLRGYYSVVSASELLVRPIRAGATSLTFMHTFLMTFPNLTALPIDLQVAAQAAALRATTGIRLPDALVVASGMLAGCEAIVSNDEQWRRKLAGFFRAFRWIYLGDYL